MEIKAYKTFKEGLLNKYGHPFEIGKIYSKDPNTLKFGENGHGYHMATSVADTFRFFNPKFAPICCEVIGTGNIIKVENHLYNSAPMYATESFTITKTLSREDILKLVFQSDINEFKRYLALYSFTKEELAQLRDWVVNKEIEYGDLLSKANIYQTGDINTFKRNSKYLRK